jgi:putative hemolysin
VRECATGAVVGTYRMLTPDDALCAGGFYSETEFDLTALRPLLSRTVELGRASVDPEFRHGGVIALLWAGLLRVVFARGYDYVMGCASIPVRGGGHAAASVCRQLLARHLSPPDRRVHPHRAFVVEGWDDVPDATVPPLIKGYLRLGAEVCGNPAWDGEFDTADLLMMLSVRSIEPRYVERLLRARA